MKISLPKIEAPLQKMKKGFTLLELLVVMTIIGILAAMVLNGAGHARTKAGRSRAAAEIAALGVALDAYKIDNGEYPQNAVSFSTGTNGATGSYATGANLLHNRLVLPDATNNNKVYFTRRPEMIVNFVSGTTSLWIIADPFGNPYGYSTPDSSGTNTYNPTYDLWSTGGKANGSTPAMWIANFPVD